MVVVGGPRRQVEGNLVLMEGDRRLGEVVGGGGPAVGAGCVVDNHNGSLNLTTGTPRLAPTLAPPPHIVALVAVHRVDSSGIVSSNTSLGFSPHGASVALVHTLVPLLPGKVGLAVNRRMLVDLVASLVDLMASSTSSFPA